MQFCFKDFCEYADRVKSLCSIYNDCNGCVLSGTRSCDLATVRDMKAVILEFAEKCEEREKNDN